MGNDGGTKALQRKYTRWGTKKEVSHYETDEEIQGKWSTCALTGDVLQEPVGHHMSIFISCRFVLVVWDIYLTRRPSFKEFWKRTCLKNSLTSGN